MYFLLPAAYIYPQSCPWYKTFLAYCLNGMPRVNLFKVDSILDIIIVLILNLTKKFFAISSRSF